MIRADARHIPLRTECIQAVVTSPPFWGLRTYGDDMRELGRENLDAYIKDLVEIFGDVHRVLRPDGHLWLNIGDTASGSGGAGGDYLVPNAAKRARRKAPIERRRYRQAESGLANGQWCNVPARLCLALQDDGWHLRASITWAKTSNAGNQMLRPESLRHANRPGMSSEMVYLFARGPGRARFYPSLLEPERGDVWHFPPVTGRYRGPAPFPDELARRCILPSTLPGDIILDPFAGSGTTGRVARAHGRRAVELDLYAS